jgi:hypothetical protein
VIGRQLVLSRSWSRSRPWDPTDRLELSNSIYGEAIAERDYVRVFGAAHRSNQFRFTLDSDLNIARSWQTIKSADLLVRKLDGERRRIRDLWHELFDKSHPTATLFYPWALECELPTAAIDQLSTDLAAARVDTVRFNIEWPFGFVMEKIMGDWGFFEDEALRGYVSSFGWLLRADATTTDPE